MPKLFKISANLKKTFQENPYLIGRVLDKVSLADLAGFIHSIPAGDNVTSNLYYSLVTYATVMEPLPIRLKVGADRNWPPKNLSEKINIIRVTLTYADYIEFLFMKEILAEQGIKDPKAQYEYILNNID